MLQFTVPTQPVLVLLKPHSCEHAEFRCPRHVYLHPAKPQTQSLHRRSMANPATLRRQREVQGAVRSSEGVKGTRFIQCKGLNN